MLKQHLLFVLCSVCGTVVKGERSSMRLFIAYGGEGKGVGFGCLCASTHSYSSAILGRRFRDETYVRSFVSAHSFTVTITGGCKVAEMMESCRGRAKELRSAFVSITSTFTNKNIH